MDYTEMIDQETLDRITETVRILVDEITKVMKNLLDHIMECLQPIMDVWVTGFSKFCIEYPNQRVVFLAFHAKKNRVRNKNHNRLVNDYIKSLQGGGGKSTE